jgi:four helix bundle protein
MTPAEMSERSMAFALRVIKMAESLPRSGAARNIEHQIVRSACSVAANYRASQRAKSRADFSNKIAIVLEEADETAFWIELTERAGFLTPERLAPLKQEAEELVKIFATMRRSARANI